MLLAPYCVKRDCGTIGCIEKVQLNEVREGVWRQCNYAQIQMTHNSLFSLELRYQSPLVLSNLLTLSSLSSRLRTTSLGEER